MSASRPRAASLLLLQILWLTSLAYAGPIPIHPPIDPHHVDGSALGGPLDLTSSWLLHQGDDPRFADPHLDDTHWLVISAGPPLQSYGLKSVDLIWYRTHAYIPPNKHNLAIELRGFFGSHQVFVNGTEVGTFGPFTGGGSNAVTRENIYRIPDAAVASGDLAIAIRASIGAASEGGTLPAGLIRNSQILLGVAPDLDESRTLYFFRDFTSNITNISLQALVLLIALALALTMRSEREYLALVLYLAANVTSNTIFAWLPMHNLPATDTTNLVLNLLELLGLLALIEFARLVAGIRQIRLIRAYQAILILWHALTILYDHAELVTALGLPNSLILLYNVINQVIYLPVLIGAPVIALSIGIRRRNRDALLLGVLFFINSLYNYFFAATFFLARLRIIASDSVPAPPIPGLYVGWPELNILCFSIFLLLFLVLRTTRLAKNQAAAAAEIRAAQSVQQLLLARASQPTPGFHIESVYLPASQVGGDFFLVSPSPQEDSITAIVGDVSGKGLTAAMRVAMILGVLRRESSRAPATILSALNEALLNQGDMGFTTACCIRLERTGAFTVANAGHIAPYIAGEELATPARAPARPRPRPGLRDRRRPPAPRPDPRAHVRRRPRSPLHQRRTLRLPPPRRTHPQQRPGHRRRRPDLRPGRRHHRPHPSLRTRLTKSGHSEPFRDRTGSLKQSRFRLA